MGIFLGLLAAVGWGTGDFLTRGVTRQIGAQRTLLYVQFFGLAAIILVALALGEFARIPSIAPSAWLVAVVSAAIGVTASLTMFTAFERGVLMIVSPIAASYGAITVLLSLLSGETLSPVRALGVGISILGIILASIELTPDAGPRVATLNRYRLPPGVAFALMAAFLFGISFWLVGFYVVPALGPVLPVVVTRGLGVVLVLPIVTLIGHHTARPPARRVTLIVLAIALLDTMAFAANNLGMATEQVSVVAVLSSMFAAVTVILAWLFLHERIRWGQWLGIGLILTGIVLVSI